MSGVSVAGQQTTQVKWVCVDFANTVEWRARSRPRDTMTGYDSFVNWGERAGILSASLADHLRSEATAHPGPADKALARALELREAIYRLLYSVANNRHRLPDDVSLLSAWYREAMTHKALVDQAEGFVWTWQDETESLDAPTWRIAQSAAGLLTSEQAGKLKSCPGEGCAWLFIDTSRNGSRRWCEMQICGNRAKVRRHRGQRET